ncbi:MAG TPA: response regulator [Chitinophagales bacterium]|nr:response regulator [Chitinophagales bacterium]
MKTTLIITKNSHLRENLCELLELAGFEVLAADTNTAGFKQAFLHHPDVIVCDMMMPETNGNMFRLLIKEERTTRDIPVIFFSAGTVPAALLNDLQHVGDLYLNNPFNDEELLVAIDWSLNKVGSKPSLALAEF